MKSMIGALLTLVILTSCAPSSLNANLTEEPSPSATTQVYTEFSNTPIPPVNTPTINPTELFITQVMGQKYAAQTEYASFPTITPTPTIPPSSGYCLPKNLYSSTGYTGSGQHIDIFLKVTNISPSPCFLPSWPIVEVLDRAGAPIQVTYDYIVYNQSPLTAPPTQAMNPGNPIFYGLDINQTADLMLSWGDWCSDAIQDGVIVRMYLLGTDSWTDIPTDVTGGGYCDDPTSSSTIDVFGFGY